MRGYIKWRFRGGFVFDNMLSLVIMVFMRCAFGFVEEEGWRLQLQL